MKKTDIVILILLSIVILGVRFYNLDADPPNGLSLSSDVYTDPPNLTLNAKQNINSTDSNTSIDNRYAFFINSSITVIAKVFYAIAGVSLFTTNAIGLFFSIGALFLFFLITQKAAGRFAAVLYLIIIALNYNQLFYGRLAFQEHSMAFWGFLAIVLLIYSENKFIALWGGISLGCCIFFGKMIGIVFLVPFLIYFIYEIIFLKNSKSKIKGIYFLGGFLILTAYWGLFVYYPMLQNVHSYLDEQVYNNHGFPLAFESISKFIGMYITIGHSSHLIARMVLVCLLASLYIFAVLYNLFSTKFKNRQDYNFNSVHIFIVTLAIAYYLFLMVWQYRPLRYQLVLIYPLCASAAIYLSYLWKSKKLFESLKFNYKYFLMLLPITVLYSSYIVFEINESLLSNYSYGFKQFVIFFGMALFAGIIYASLKLKQTMISNSKKNFSKSIVLLALIIIVCINGYRYFDWAVRPTFTVRDNSLDLQTVLSPNAFLAGSYASTLTIETKYNSLIHMFGVSEPDPDFFKKYPVTHILINKKNEQNVKKDYPSIMQNAVNLLTYYVGATQVSLIRVAGLTNNSQASNYELSTYEKLVLAINGNSDTEFNNLANKFLLEHPKNISGNMLIVQNALQKGNIPQVESSLLKAIEFSPTNYTLLAVLARFYKDLYVKTKRLEYKNKGLIFYEKALKLFPNSNRLNRELTVLKQAT